MDTEIRFKKVVEIQTGLLSQKITKEVKKLDEKKWILMVVILLALFLLWAVFLATQAKADTFSVPLEVMQALTQDEISFFFQMVAQAYFEANPDCAEMRMTLKIDAENLYLICECVKKKVVL